MHRLLFAIALTGCGGFDLDARIEGRPGHTILIVDGREKPYIDQSFTFPTYADALQFPATVALADPDGRNHEIELNVRACAYDGEVGWEHGDFDYALEVTATTDGTWRLSAGVRSAGCTKADQGTSVVVDRVSGEQVGAGE